MPLIRRLSPTLDGGPVALGGGESHITIPEGEYTTPFWVRFASGAVHQVDSLPWRVHAAESTIEILSESPVSAVGRDAGVAWDCRAAVGRSASADWNVAIEAPAAVVWGALGDSQTDEYRANDDRANGSAYEASTLNWLEQLAAPSGASGVPVNQRGLNFGTWGTRAEPRRTGFEYNWARSGVTMEGVLDDQVAGLAAQVSAGTVTHVVLFGTGNEWVNLSPFLVPIIYNSPDGGVTAQGGASVGTLMDNLAAQYASAIDDIVAAGVVGMVVLMPFDYVLFPGVFADFPNATRRGYVSAAIADLRSQIEAHAVSVNATAGETVVVVVESDADMLAVWATDDGTHVTAAGVDLTYTSDAPDGEPEYFALAATTGSAHMGTVANGVIANTFVFAANQLPGISIAPFTSAEIRENAGMSGGAEPLAFADFEDDTLGDFSHGGSSGGRGEYEVIADPTPRNSGNVVHLTYNPEGDVDSYLSWSPGSGVISAGDTVYCYGRFYIVSNGFTGNRKLWRYYVGAQGGDGSDITLWMSTTLRAEGPDGARDNYFVNTGAAVSRDAWHELEVQMTLDSSAGAGDGVFRVWLDGTQVLNNTAFQFTNASNPEVDIIRFGYQTQSTRTENGELEDNRYWDDVTISTERIGA